MSEITCKDTLYLSGEPTGDDSHRVTSPGSPGCTDTIYLSGMPKPASEVEQAPEQPNPAPEPQPDPQPEGETGDPS